MDPFISEGLLFPTLFNVKDSEDYIYVPVIRIDLKCFLDIHLSKIQIDKLNISLGSPVKRLNILAVSI